MDGLAGRIAEHGRAIAEIMRATMPLCAKTGCDRRNDDRYGETGSPFCEECRR